VLAIGGDTVGDALARQLAPMAPDLTSRIFDRCRHILPEDAPDQLVDELRAFLQRDSAAAR